MLVSSGGSGVLTRTRLAENHADAGGGAIMVILGGAAHVSESTVTLNTVGDPTRDQKYGSSVGAGVYAHTNVSTALAPYTSWPQERCSAAKCHKSHCQHCVDLAPDDDLSTGSARRVSSSEYRQLMGRATFCLVLSGDMPGRDVGESEVELQPINTSTRATESHNTPSLHH